MPVPVERRVVTLGLIALSLTIYAMVSTGRNHRPETGLPEPSPLTDTLIAVYGQILGHFGRSDMESSVHDGSLVLAVLTLGVCLLLFKGRHSASIGILILWVVMSLLIFAADWSMDVGPDRSIPSDGEMPLLRTKALPVSCPVVRSTLSPTILVMPII